VLTFDHNLSTSNGVDLYYQISKVSLDFSQLFFLYLLNLPWYSLYFFDCYYIYYRSMKSFTFVFGLFAESYLFIQIYT
jgi:hypothetical protein